MDKRFMMYLDNPNNKYYPLHSYEILLEIRKKLQILNNVEIRDVRISSYFIEIDLSIFGFEEKIKNDIISKLAYIGNCLLADEIVETKVVLPKEHALSIAIFLFNTERYWKSHEVLEQIWKNEHGIEKSILNGLILIDAAFVHFQKDEFDIFLSILRRALEKFKGFKGKFHNIMVDEILNDIGKIIETKKVYPFKIRII